ncbi:hypothetical protein HNP84_009700 [Thermocatellispora tengchongensis]|uniref:Uncharacterized protein n=1 Tax=Thermocatellispora tengchongensis TaxID=1073253 RepID=A0A840PM02_9ACTN|nr:hypothetical protein [Thermocatellispora tengchongensis]MBB5139936.1 hypothetical protein [Thermocatellispora tengchongensis]
MDDEGPLLPEIWRTLLNPVKSWVVFAHGTCVILMDPAPGDLAAQAVDLLREYGPVVPGTPAGDFDVIHLEDAPGWAVACHHPDILTYVAPDEVAVPDDLRVGLAGRAKRDADGRELTVVHVEDRR